MGQPSAVEDGCCSPGGGAGLRQGDREFKATVRAQYNRALKKYQEKSGSRV